jgi:uncharacterized membrane protein YbaN (DUF454 family)
MTGLILSCTYIIKKAAKMDSFKKVGILIVGWFFIGLGIIGLFLPILQGILFLMIGLSILSSRSELIKRYLKKLGDRYPKHHKKVEMWKEKIMGWFKRS